MPTLAFRVLALASALAAWALVAVGGIVRVTESGLGCPDWPLCEGRVVPTEQKAPVIEFSHRATATIVTVLVLVAAVWAWRHYRTRRDILAPALLAALLVPVQALLGAIVVWLELPGWIVAVHFLVGMLFLAATVATAARAWHRPLAVTVGFARTAWSAAAAGVLLVSAGAAVVAAHAGEACGREWPTCNGGLADGGTLAAVQVVHRMLAYAVAALAVALAVLAWRSAGARVLAALPLAAVAGQMAIGVLMVLSHDDSAAHAPLEMAHVAGAGAVWAALVALAARVGRPAPRPRIARRAAPFGAAVVGDVSAVSSRPPLVVAWEVTRACPLACRHCRATAQHRPHPAELTTDEGRAFMADLAQAFPGAMLIFTGGEPLTRADVLALAREGARLGLVTALSVDVGWLLTPDVCAEIRAAGVSAVSFSLHFPDLERSDRFAGTPGFHAAALAGLANLRRAGQRFQLHTTVMRANASLLPRMHRLVIELGAAAWELFFLVPTGRGRLLAEEELPAAEQERVLRWLYRLQRRSTIPVKQICAPHFRRVEAQVARARGERRSARLTTRLGALSRGCLAGQGFAFVSHVGDVCGCGFLPLSVGNVRDRAFPELYLDSPLFQAFRDPSRLGGDCGACEFRALCGGCRARAYAATGDPLAEEPDCAYLPARTASSDSRRRVARAR